MSAADTGRTKVAVVSSLQSAVIVHYSRVQNKKGKKS